jgi:YihY family inner membrane protein
MAANPRLDDFQRRHTWLGLPIGVLYKFIDDQGAYLAALITYYGFLSLFPLLLLGASALGFVLHSNPTLRSDILGSALANFPIIGSQLRSNVTGYHGSGAALVIGIIGSIYGGLGIAQAGQNAMNAVWSVPRNDRPNPFKSRLRSIGLLLTLGVGVLITTGLGALASELGTISHTAAGHTALRVGAWLVTAALNVGLFIVAFRVLTAYDCSIRDVWLGATIAGVLWQVLQSVGAHYVSHELNGQREVYGLFGIVLGLVAWIYLEALVVVLCAELNVVVRRRLWPRALLTPFTDAVNLTDADELVYELAAKAARHKGFERIDVDFDEQATVTTAAYDDRHEPDGAARPA